jgi:hypothetical protein
MTTTTRIELLSSHISSNTLEPTLDTMIHVNKLATECVTPITTPSKNRIAIDNVLGWRHLSLAISNANSTNWKLQNR